MASDCSSCLGSDERKARVEGGREDGKTQVRKEVRASLRHICERKANVLGRSAPKFEGRILAGTKAAEAHPHSL